MIFATLRARLRAWWLVTPLADSSSDMRTIFVGRWCLVFLWYGLRGSLARYRWGILGNKWPTIYAGPVKVVTGPR